jgi:CxxC-x17-CxxC domain-containing protein
MAFNRDRNSRPGGGFRGRPSFGGKPRFDRNDRGPVEMHKAICDNCGKECEVPFRPTSGKPIYCSSCFENKRGGDDRRERSFDRPSFERPNFDRPQSPSSDNNLKQQIDALNSKVDKILNILEAAAMEDEQEFEEEENEEQEVEQETTEPETEPETEEVVEEKPSKKASKKK